MLFGNLYNDKSDEYESQFYTIALKIKAHGIDLYLPGFFFDTLSSVLKEKIKSFISIFESDFPKVDLAFSIGGDGTFLRTANAIAHFRY